MKKYLSKAKIYLPIAGVLLIAFFTVGLNILLLGPKKFVIKSGLPDKDYSITIQKINYIFPNTLYLNDVQIKKISFHNKHQFINLPQVKINIVLSEFIFKKNVDISNVILNNPNIQGYQSVDNLQKDILDIQSAFQGCPPIAQSRSSATSNMGWACREKGSKCRKNFATLSLSLSVSPTSVLCYGTPALRYKNIKLKLIKGTIYLGKDRFDIDFDFKKKNSALSSQGSIHKHTAEGNALDLKYKFFGNLTKKGISISNFELNKNLFYTKLRGNYTHNSLNLKGFALLQLKPLGKNQLPSHYLSDLDTQFQLTSSSIEIQKFTATLDNIPINLTGNISLTKLPTFDLSLSMDPRYLPLKQLIQFQTANIKIKGEIKKSFIFSSGRLLLSQKTPNYFLRIDFEDLNTLFAEYPNIQFQLQKGVASWNSKKKHIQIVLNNLNALFDATNPDHNVLTFDTPFYDGELKGIWKMNNHPFSKKITSKITLTDINIDALAQSSPYFSKIGGALDGIIIFKNYPQWDINGQINLQDGNLNDFDFLNWFAEYFALPSAQTINFQKTAFYFLINEKGLRMRNIALTSDNISLNGYFNLNENNFVSSKFSLYLTRDLIKKSARLKYMLKRIPETIDPLQFNFRLSGRREALNFQWLTSDSKERLMEKIPKFILRKIENRVEDSIGDVSVK